MFDLNAYLEACEKRVNLALDRWLPPEDERPALLHRAMRYSVFGGGKRLRPILCLAAAELCGVDAERAMKPAVALECLHTYTLIHDDLPAMDDDDLRRGRASAHIAFGEANAILAGDALLTFAFELLADCPAPSPYAPCALAGEMAAAAGSRGVAGGQFEDLASEGQAPDEETVAYIHYHKTAILLRASCRMGAIAAGADAAALAALSLYGDETGRAFQMADDLLDVTSDAATLGKHTQRDAENGKMTFIELYGVEATRHRAAGCVERAIEALRRVPGDSEPLTAIARHIVRRSC